ncbi:hypothetical protein BDW42DRAFT_159032 [Aspergillus taichungensis]|uniref:Uncharacterized protein n=1 Tax=Aspergillus taichungensis TaxID=482145 RepID=A0A2J5I8G6_9EURO|nr:hypothetical protein BDW42DRAFT_159032 [Aspergillus taichungensis]
MSLVVEMSDCGMCGVWRFLFTYPLSCFHLVLSSCSCSFPLYLSFSYLRFMSTSD